MKTSHFCAQHVHVRYKKEIVPLTKTFVFVMYVANCTLTCYNIVIAIVLGCSVGYLASKCCDCKIYMGVKYGHA